MAMEAGSNDFTTKPIGMNKLKQILRKADLIDWLNNDSFLTIYLIND